MHVVLPKLYTRPLEELFFIPVETPLVASIRSREGVYSHTRCKKEVDQITQELSVDPEKKMAFRVYYGPVGPSCKYQLYSFSEVEVLGQIVG